MYIYIYIYISLGAAVQTFRKTVGPPGVRWRKRASIVCVGNNVTVFLPTGF